jgi:hypothetical protein
LSVGVFEFLARIRNVGKPLAGKKAMIAALGSFRHSSLERSTGPVAAKQSAGTAPAPAFWGHVSPSRMPAGSASASHPA